MVLEEYLGSGAEFDQIFVNLLYMYEEYRKYPVLLGTVEAWKVAEVGTAQDGDINPGVGVDENRRRCPVATGIRRNESCPVASGYESEGQEGRAEGREDEGLLSLFSLQASQEEIRGCTTQYSLLHRWNTW